MQLIETKTLGLPQFTTPSLSNISPAKIGGLLCSALLYGAALRAVAPYSLNSTRKVAYFLGAEALVTVGLHFFPVHHLVMNYFGKVDPFTTVLEFKRELTDNEVESIKDWARGNQTSLCQRVYALENQSPFVSRIYRVALFAIAIPAAGYLFRKAIPTISSNQLACSFITLDYVTFHLRQIFTKYLISNDSGEVLDLTDVCPNSDQLIPAAKARRVAFLQQAIREKMSGITADSAEASQPSQDTPLDQNIRQISQVGIAALILYSTYLEKTLDRQVPSLSSDASRSLRVANWAVYIFGIGIFRNLISQTAEVAFPNYVW